jgi:hypothetical protein
MNLSGSTIGLAQAPYVRQAFSLSFTIVKEVIFGGIDKLKLIGHFQRQTLHWCV